MKMTAFAVATLAVVSTAQGLVGPAAADLELTMVTTDEAIATPAGR